MEKIINDKEFGNINVILKPNKKNITLRIKPDKGIMISAAVHTPQEVILAVIEKKRIWLRKHLETINIKSSNKHLFLPDIEFKTRQHSLQLDKHTDSKIFLSISNGIIRFVIPSNMEWEEDIVQKNIKIAITEALRIEALQYLPGRLYELSQKHNFKVSGLFIKNIKTRWGSCSEKGNINLSVFLMLLPNNLIDHILLHELCHLKEMNHGEKFKKLLFSLDTNAKQHIEDLKKIHIGNLLPNSNR